MSLATNGSAQHDHPSRLRRDRVDDRARGRRRATAGERVRRRRPGRRTGPPPSSTPPTACPPSSPRPTSSRWTEAGFEAATRCAASSSPTSPRCVQAAEANGTPIVVISGYRSFDYQENLFADRVVRGRRGRGRAAHRPARPQRAPARHRRRRARPRRRRSRRPPSPTPRPGSGWPPTPTSTASCSATPTAPVTAPATSSSPGTCATSGRDVAAEIHESGVTAREWMLAQAPMTPADPDTVARVIRRRPPRRARRLAGLPIVALLAVGVVACAQEADGADEGDDDHDGRRRRHGCLRRRLPAADEIAWEDCGSAECGTLEVPVDYDDPDGRHPARSASPGCPRATTTTASAPSS